MKMAFTPEPTRGPVGGSGVSSESQKRMADHTVDAAKLDAYILSAIRDEHAPWVHSARIAADTLLEVTVETPGLPHHAALLELFGLTGTDDVYAINMLPDHAEVIRRPIIDGIACEVTEHYDYR